MKVDDNPIRGDGTSLAQWQASSQLAVVPSISPHLLLPDGNRLVVVAPHPDDEVLMCGGWLAAMSGHEDRLLLVSVTDGDASHRGSFLWPASRLRAVRPRESRQALACLGLDTERLQWLRLGLADSQVADSEARLAATLCDLLRPGDRVLTTWRHDGHCDHEAVGRACARAASQCAARLLEVPVWAWHWAAPNDARLPWLRARKMPVDPARLARKREAIAAHVSQLHPDPSTQAPPILSPAALERLLQPFELIFL